METTTKSTEIKRYHYKSYELPNGLVFSRDLKGDRTLFNFTIESSENIGIGIPLLYGWRSDIKNFALNLDEKFDGMQYTDSLGNVYTRDDYYKYNGLHSINGAPPVVSTVYGGKNLGIIMSLTDGNVSRCFNSAGLLVLIIALNRHNLYIERDANNKITNIYDRFNANTFNKYTFVYDANSRLTAVNKICGENSVKKIVTLTYSSSTLKSFSNVHGALTLAYTNSKISSIESSLGYKITYSSNKLEVKSTLTQVPNGVPTSTAPVISSWSFDLSNGVNKITDVDGNREIYKFTDYSDYYFKEEGGVVTYAECTNYDDKGNLVGSSIADKRILNKNKYEYFVYASKEYTAFTYNDDGTLSQKYTIGVESDFISSVKTDYTYSTYSYFKFLVGNENTTITYKNYLEPTKEYVKQYYYDSENRISHWAEYETSSKETKGITVVRYEYDSSGNLVKTTTHNTKELQSKFRNEYEYDEFGRLTMLKTAEKQNIKLTYANGSRLPNEKTVLPNDAVNYPRNGAGRISRVYSGSLKNSIINISNELTSLADTTGASGHIYFNYDNQRRLKEVRLGTDKLQSYEYAKGTNDKTLTKTNALNETFKIVAQKDGMGVKTYYNGNLELESNCVMMSDDEGDYDWYELTVKDHITSETEVFSYLLYGTLSSYNVGTKSVYSNYSERYSHNEYGDLYRVQLQGLLNVDYKYKYTALKQLESESYNNIKINNTYDFQQRLSRRETYYGQLFIQKEEISYTGTAYSNETALTHIPFKIDFYSGHANLKKSVYNIVDTNGRVVSVQYDGNSISYTYDKYNRLIRENNTAFDRTRVFEYDTRGNITSVKTYAYTGSPILTDETVINYTYSGNKLTSYNGENCVYDAIGNPTTYRNKTATWKGRQMQSFNGITFKYDGRGRRIDKGDVTYYYDSIDRLIKTSDGLEFFYDMTGLSSFKYNGATYYYRKDMMGNIIAILDSSGEIVVEYSYDAWGNHKIKAYNQTVANANPFRYRSYFYDTDTGLYYLKTRYYDPEVGRFLNMDAVDYADPETLGGLNLYSYCNNNPVMYVDPTGHEFISLLLIIAGIVGGGVVNGLIAGANAAEGESFGSAFLGGFVNGVISGIGLAAGLAVASLGGMPAIIAGGAIAVSLGFAGGTLGSVTTQAISYGNVDMKVALISGALSAGTNLILYTGLGVSDMYSTSVNFLTRFAENLAFDIIPFSMSFFLGTLPFFNPNELRGKI